MKNKQIIIKRWDNDKIIIKTSKYESISKLLEKEEISYYCADLRNADLQGADLQGADLQGADLRGVDFRNAYLRNADLQGADLRGVDFRNAYLRNAYLQGADLRGVDFRGANLRNADLQDINKFLILPDLYFLKLQNKNNKIKMWKWLKQDNLSPYQNFKYEIGKEYKFNKFNKNEHDNCGAGGNIATLQWCLKDDFNANIFMEIEFYIKNIIAIPYQTDGKIRVKKFKTLRIIDRKQALKLLNKDLS